MLMRYEVLLWLPKAVREGMVYRVALCVLCSSCVCFAVTRYLILSKCVCVFSVNRVYPGAGV